MNGCGAMRNADREKQRLSVVLRGESAEKFKRIAKALGLSYNSLVKVLVEALELEEKGDEIVVVIGTSHTPIATGMKRVVEIISSAELGYLRKCCQGCRGKHVSASAG